MLELLALRKGMTLTKEMFLNHSLWRHGRARTKNHRRVHVQAAKESRQTPRAAKPTSKPCGVAVTC